MKRKRSTTNSRFLVEDDETQYVVSYYVKKGIWNVTVYKRFAEKTIEPLHIGASKPPTIESANDYVDQYLKIRGRDE